MLAIFVLLVLLQLMPLYPQEDYKIISSNHQSIIFEYLPIYTDTSIVRINNSDYLRIQIKLGVVPENILSGMPAIPERRFKIGVPTKLSSSIRILSSSYIEMDGNILPTPRYTKEKNLQKTIYEISPDYGEYEQFPELVSFGDFGIARGLGIQSIRVFPVKYDVSARRIRLYTKIVFQIDYGIYQKSLVSAEDNLLRNGVLNYNVAKSWINRNNKTLKFTKESVLAQGDWVRFETSSEGIYKIDRTILSTFGFNPDLIDPRTIKIYNNGGKALPENIDADRPQDLIENSILVYGENDGRFDNNDYILFYGRGSNFWDIDEDNTIRRFNHPFSDKNYFWITYGGNFGKRIQSKSSLNTTPDFIQNSTTAFIDYEVDKINLAKSGREFFGDDFSQGIPSRTYNSTLEGRISSIPINYKFRFVNASSEVINLQVSENTNSIFLNTLNGYGTALYTVGVAYTKFVSFNGNLTDNKSILKFNLVNATSSAVGYLDYFELKYEKELKPFENRLLFFSKDTSGIIDYQIDGLSSNNIKVFDVTEFSEVKTITDLTFLNSTQCSFQINENSDSLRKYIVVCNDDYYTPTNAIAIPNSNIRGIQTGAKFIIITHKNFLEAADRLKSYRENEAQLQLSTIVIDVDNIYNEFACGIKDITAIRDFIKHAYDTWQIVPEYFLLLGKGTYDYKDIEGFGDNFIPTWQTQESLALIQTGNSYCTDDYYACIDGPDLIPDIAFGRITSKNITQANNYINKVIQYENNMEKGSWRNLITLIADDGKTTNGDDGKIHTAGSEILAAIHTPKSIDIKKIYLAEYPATITASGRRKPLVNEAIIKAMNEGTILVNYIGHGNPNLWAHEVVFDRNVSIPQLYNDKYFFLSAATCDFGNYDTPNFQSGAEDIYLSSNTGSIASFSAARVVYSDANQSLNFELFDNLFSQPRDTLNLPITIGKAVYLTKLSKHGINDRKFHLLGDPTIRLLLPQYFGKIDSVNGIPLIDDIQLKALGKTEIIGTILKSDSTKWTDFNGEGVLTVFDSERSKYLDEIRDTIIIPGGVIFRGRVSVSDGDFQADFVVPKDISYENKNGKIIFYFSDGISDGLAFTTKIKVGGTDTTAINDGNGPEIEIFFDDENYYNAYLVGPEPNLIVQLSDETGLNTTGSGVGHKLEGILNDDNTNPIDFTDYFTGDLDAGGRSGKIKYKFYKLIEGDYSIQIKAWDVFNNFSEEESFFTVVNDNSLVIRDVYNYPNPFSSNTTFTFQHNLNRSVNVKIKIYTIAGRLIKEIEESNINQKFVKIYWDGRDADGSVIANSTYLYKVIVKTTDGEFSQSILGKLAVIK